MRKVELKPGYEQWTGGSWGDENTRVREQYVWNCARRAALLEGAARIRAALTRLGASAEPAKLTGMHEQGNWDAAELERMAGAPKP